MKSSDIKKAYEAVKAPQALKEKIMFQAEESMESPGGAEAAGTSRIKLLKGGKKHRAVLSAAYAAAAAFAVMISLSVLYGKKPAYPDNEVSNAVSITEADDPALPPDTAEVPLRVTDENGMLLRDLRIDYFPVKDDISGADISGIPSWMPGSMVFDEEHRDRTGTVLVTGEDEETVRIHYGLYLFVISDALPNDTFEVCNKENYNDGSKVFSYGYAGNSGYLHSPAMTFIDEKTTVLEITVQSALLEADPDASPAEIILQDERGNPIYDCTVILSPVSGVMAEGYSDIYGGYVLPRTDRDGRTLWNYPVEGEYTVVAYKEKLHTADVPAKYPLEFDGDNTLICRKEDSTNKTFIQAPDK